MRVSDENKCKHVGLRRCTEERVSKILSDRIRFSIRYREPFYNAANKLKRKINYEVYDFMQLIRVTIVHVI